MGDDDDDDDEEEEEEEGEGDEDEDEGDDGRKVCILKFDWSGVWFFKKHLCNNRPDFCKKNISSESFFVFGSVAAFSAQFCWKARVRRVGL